MNTITLFTLVGTEPSPTGTISFDGQQIIAAPQDSKILQTIINSPIRINGRVYTASKHPQQWLELLPTKYRSPYFWAEKV